MSYTPKTDEQLDKEGLLPEGTYDFEVTDTSDRPSKAGNFMYTLKLTVFDDAFGSQHVWDYIALGSNFGERKLRHAADACGILNIYETGNMKPSDFQGKTGKVKLKMQEAKDGYAAKNAVEDYVKRDVQPTASSAANPANDLSDEIPFIWTALIPFIGAIFGIA